MKSPHGDLSSENRKPDPLEARQLLARYGIVFRRRSATDPGGRLLTAGR